MLATAWSINFAKPLLVPGSKRCPRGARCTWYATLFHVPYLSIKYFLNWTAPDRLQMISCKCSVLGNPQLSHAFFLSHIRCNLLVTEADALVQAPAPHPPEPSSRYPLFSANAATGQFDDTATNAGRVPFNTINRT